MSPALKLRERLDSHPKPPIPTLQLACNLGEDQDPQWIPDAAIDREYETDLYRFYGRPVYWSLGQLPAEEESPHHAGLDTK